MTFKTLAKNPAELTILVTGGAGFIGSHTCVELISAGYNVVVADDLSNSSAVALDRVAQIASPRDGQLSFYEIDINDASALDKVFKDSEIDAVIHFAAFKAVGESMEKPLEYYVNNISGSLNLYKVARDNGVKNIVFSSSATVYGDAKTIPITEFNDKLPATNPYGKTKSMNEDILSDLFIGDGEYCVALLRYFNPVGAHESGLIGEDPKGIPNNLMPYVAQVATGKLERLGVFGNDYDTPDGTGVRDYIHVVDLARGHVAALEWMAGRCGTGDASDPGTILGPVDADGMRHGVGVFNLGTGQGYSVLDIVEAFSRACGSQIPYEFKPRRAGDIAVCYSSCAKASAELGWVAQRDLDKMCEDAWNWQSQNPNGYDS